jgi:hypothetical protein
MKQSTELITLAAGTVSAEIATKGADAIGILLPGTFTGTALTFQVAEKSGGTFKALNNDSGAISITVAQDKAYLLPASLLAFPYFKIVSGSSEGADRSIRIFRKGQASL